MMACTAPKEPIAICGSSIRAVWAGWLGDEESQTVMGRPWNVLPEDQPADCPPQGDWVSRKGAKSYVYDLVHEAPGDP